MFVSLQGLTWTISLIPNWQGFKTVDARRRDKKPPNLKVPSVTHSNSRSTFLDLNNYVAMAFEVPQHLRQRLTEVIGDLKDAVGRKPQKLI